MTVTLVGTSWGFDDSGHLRIAQPAGLQVGDLVMALLGNQGNSFVGAGFVPGAGMPATPRLFLHSYPGPGVGGTLDWWYWTFAGTEPDPFDWTCAAIIDLGIVLAFRSDGAAITPDVHSTADNASSASSPTSSLVGVANRFSVGCWYTQSGGVTLDWTAPGDMTTLFSAVDGGTLRQVELAAIRNTPVGAYTETAHLTQAQDSCAYMTQWVGTWETTAATVMLPLLGVGP